MTGWTGEDRASRCLRAGLKCDRGTRAEKRRGEGERDDDGIAEGYCAM